MNQLKTKNFFITLLLLDTALFLVYGFLLYSARNKEKETMALYAVSHQREADKEKIREIKRVLEDTKEDRAKLDEHFIQKANTVTFIEQIEKVGKDAGVTLSVSSVGDAPKGSVGLQLDFSATGGFSDFYRLVSLVELMPYKIVLKKADIQKVDTGGSWRGTFTIMLESFIAPTLPAANSEPTGETVKK